MKKRVVFGLPLTPAHLLEQLSGASFCVSYWTRKSLGKQLDQVIRLVGEDEILLVDNGAFSAWRANESMSAAYWDDFAVWASDILQRCPQAVVVIPDVIDGTETENDDLINDFLGCELELPDVDLPMSRCMAVWHMHENIDRLYGLIEGGFHYIAIGSSGEYAQIGTSLWHARIAEAIKCMNAFCADSNGAYVLPWLHMMRAQSMAHLYPFDSSDSTNVAVNHHKHKLVDDHVRLYADRIIHRVRYSCDGAERRGIESPALVAALDSEIMMA